MFNLKSLWQLPEQIREIVIEEGDLVTDKANPEAGVGVLVKVSVSPYYAEERAGIVRGYVLFQGSADWYLPTELILVAKATAIKTAALAS